MKHMKCIIKSLHRVVRIFRLSFHEFVDFGIVWHKTKQVEIREMKM